jgi:hypothetical protein
VTANSPGGVVFNRTAKPLFAFGLCYVAMSRCQSILDLLLEKPINIKDFLTHRSVRLAIEEEYAIWEKRFPQRISLSQLRDQRLKVLNGGSNDLMEL